MTQTTFDEAVTYVRSNKTWTDAEERIALNHIDRYRCSIYHAAPHIADSIYDLMEEYGEENNLPEGWWLEFGDEDYVFYNL